MGLHSRIFTLEEVEKILPLVERIVREVVEKYEMIKEYSFLVQDASEKRQKAITNEALELKKEMEEAIMELKILGVELKSIETGLIDFPYKRGGELVYLCWKLGEKTISFWHDLESGYMGRQPI